MIIRRVKWSIQRQISNSAVTGGSEYLPDLSAKNDAGVA